MSGFKYQTRDDLVSAVRNANPDNDLYRSGSGEHVYEDFIKRFPEYKAKVAENYTSLQMGGDEQRDPMAEEKDFFTGMSEIFSKDFYKYVPFVRDAELFEVGGLLKASNDMQDGTATDSQISSLKEWMADEERPTSWGYNTLMIVAGALPFWGEIAATTAFAAGTSGAGAVAFGRIGAVKATKATLKAAAKKAVLKGAKKHATVRVGAKIARGASKKAALISARLGGSAVGLGAQTAKAGVKEGAERVAGSSAVDVAGNVLKKGWKNLGNREMATRLGDAATLARHGHLKSSMIRMAEDAGSKNAKQFAMKYGLKTLGVGVGEAAMMTAFRAPQVAMNQMERMMPEMRLSEGLDHEIAVEVLDDGDSFMPALIKAYADLGIEFFSENVGASLTLAHNLWGREVLRSVGAKAGNTD